METLDTSTAIWTFTVGFVVLLIAIDLFLHRKPKGISLQRAGVETIVWTIIGIGFGLFVLATWGSIAAGEYFAGYTLERTLSIDNVFVFVVILSYFAVPPQLQHRALTFGVIVALILRAIFIFAGVAILERAEWMTYVFGAIVLFSAWKLYTSDEGAVEPDHNIALRGLRKIVPVSGDYDGTKLMTHIGGKRRAVTPLFAVLLVLGTTDLVFAVDSIPAIFAVTRDSFLIFTSNAFALLGLRPMSVLLAQVMDRFVYVKHALAVILAMVGIKMLGSHYFHLNVWVSLGLIMTILAIGIIYSIYKTGHEQDGSHQHDRSGLDSPRDQTDQ